MSSAGGTTTPEHRSALLDAVAGAAQLDHRRLSDAALMEQVTEYERAARLLDAARAHAIAELDARQVVNRDLGMRTADWVGLHTPQHPAAVKARVRIGQRLDGTYRELDEALTAGRIGWDHVAVLDRVTNGRNIDRLPAFYPALIELAQCTGFDHWAREVAGVAQRLDEDGRPPAGDRNELHLSRYANNIAKLTGTLEGEDLLCFEHLVLEELDVVRRDYDRAKAACPDVRVPGSAEMLAEALMRVIRRSAQRSDDNSEPARPEFVVMVDPDTDRATTPNGDPVPRSVIRALVLTAMIRHLAIDENGNPLNMGRRLRYANRAQRRAVACRDGCCVFPGCNRRIEQTDLHHVHEWEHGGGTDIANLAPLCRFHHRITHRRGWTMHSTEDQWFYWTTPSGGTLWGQRHGRQKVAPAPGEPAPASTTSRLAGG